MKKNFFSKYNILILILLFISLLLASIFFFILPEIIAIQWEGLIVTKLVSKNYIFIFPTLCLFIACLSPVLNYIIKRYLLNYRLAPYTIISLLILIISGEIYTILFAIFGQTKVTISGVFITEIIILIVLYFIPMLYKTDK